jgi:AraC-like DNA-binding protein
MQYTEYHPCPGLKPWVAAHFSFSVRQGVPETDHWIPPNGGLTISVWRGAEPMLTGPQIEPFQTRVRGGLQVWGAILWPGTAAALLGVDPAQLRSTRLTVREAVGELMANQLVELQTQFDDEMQVITGLDAILKQRLPAAVPLDSQVMRAVFCLIQSRGQQRVAQTAASVELSTRQLARRFRREVGLTPKEFARVQRLRSCAIEAAVGGSEAWVNLAAEFGYADQPHLIREFRDLLGVTPGDFELHFGKIEHRRLVR